MARKKTPRPPSKRSPVAAFIGIDWADEKHDIICLRAAGSNRRETDGIEHTPEALDDWGGRLGAPIFAGFPGAGEVMAPRLLAAFGANRDRFPRPETIQNYSEIAPVTERSGHPC